MRLSEDDKMIYTPAPDRSDQPLSVSANPEPLQANTLPVYAPAS